MKPSELRDSIPVLRDSTYLNTGAGGPSPTGVTSAVCRGAMEHESLGFAGESPYEWADSVLDTASHRVAEFIECSEEEVAMTTSTTDGINRVIGSLVPDEVDSVYLSRFEHPSGVLPWLRYRELYGIEVRRIGNHGYVDADELRESLTGSGGEVVFVSSITWSHGTRIDIEALSGVCGEMNALLVVDGVQSMGQEPVDVKAWGADVVVGAGHKWMLGPFGAGFIYVDSEVIDGFEPVYAGYNGVTNPFADEVLYKDSASRLEIGSQNPAVYTGLLEAIDVIERVGLNVIENRIDDLVGYLASEIPDDVLLLDRQDSGLVALDVKDAEGVADRLRLRDIYVRDVPLNDALRVCLHVFNTRGDVDVFIDALSEEEVV